MSILIVHRPKIVYVVYTERAKNVDFLRVIIIIIKIYQSTIKQ